MFSSFWERSSLNVEPLSNYLAISAIVGQLFTSNSRPNDLFTTQISVCRSSVKGKDIQPQHRNLPLCFRKLRSVITQRRRKQIHTASSLLRSQGEVKLRIQKINTYCHHKEPRWLYIYYSE